MKKVSIVCFSTVIALIAVLSCNKDTNSLPTSNSDYLTSKPWLTVHTWTKPALDSPWSLIDTLIPVCQRDNLLTFTSDLRFSVNEGTLKCDTTKGSPQVILTGTWSLQNNQSILVVGSALGSQSMSIEVLNSSMLQVSYQESSVYFRKQYIN